MPQMLLCLHRRCITICRRQRRSLRLADGPQLIGMVTGGIAARTHGPPIMVEVARGSTIGMVGMVAANAMVLEAATTMTIMPATTERRAKAWDISEHTLRKKALLRPAAVTVSTTGRKMPMWKQTLLLMPMWTTTSPTTTTRRPRLPTPLSTGLGLLLRVRGPAYLT